MKMPKVKSGRFYGGYFLNNEIRRRELGNKITLGWESKIKNALYSSLMPFKDWNDSVCHGGVYNLEFSPDGSHLVAACENRAVMVFDPLLHRQIHHIPNAHENCVNCIKFLDSKMFASCSDDHTVALWDIRSLKSHVRLLRGHSDWVKNVEYSASENMLVTSGFDGKILGWDINGYTEEGLCYSELFNMQGLMRMRLTPDSSKLIICTTGGYMVIIHDLSLPHLSQDLFGFKPNVYRLMQLSAIPISRPASFTHLFSAKRNRVEFISDFPHLNKAESIHSLQVHPQGWCVLSRNTSNEDSAEWTCVHDIQDLIIDEESLDSKDVPSKELMPEDCPPIPSSSETSRPFSNPTVSGSQSADRNTGTNQTGEDGSPNVHVSFTFNPRMEIVVPQWVLGNTGAANAEDQNMEDDNDNGNEDNSNYGSYDHEDDEGDAPDGADGEGNGVNLNIQLRFTSMEVYDALEHIRRTRREERRAAINQRQNQETRNNNPGTSSSRDSPRRNVSFSLRTRRDRNRETPEQQSRDTERGSDSSLLRFGNAESHFFVRNGHQHAIFYIPQEDHSVPRPRTYTYNKDLKIAKNAPRLTHYIPEPNVGGGVIKELCFSADGRLICSPFGNGVRLMMFDKDCSELSHCVREKAQKLYDVLTNTCHTSCVVSTKFSPKHCLLVSGCLDGKIVWHHPKL